MKTQQRTENNEGNIQTNNEQSQFGESNYGRALINDPRGNILGFSFPSCNLHFMLTKGPGEK